MKTFTKRFRGNAMFAASTVTSGHALSAACADAQRGLYDEDIRLHGYSPEPVDKAQVRGYYEGIFRVFGMPKLELHEVM